MKNRNFVASLGTRYLNGNVNTTGMFQFQDRVTSSPVIKGDFRQPNNWSYTVDFSRGFNGRIDELQMPWKSTFKWSGEFQGLSSLPTWERDLLYNRALSNLNEKVRGGLDLSVGLAEAGKTAQMIKALGKASTYLSGFGPKRWANDWLQYQYGWVPLISDVYASADESIRYVLNKIQRFKAGTRSPIGHYVSTLNAGVGGIRPAFVAGSGIQACTFSIWMEVKDFDLARWTSLNPLSIAWELMPYSFVIDWFYDIGGTLRALETSLLYNTSFRSGYVSELFAFEGTSQFHPDTWRITTGVPGRDYNDYYAVGRSYRVYKSFQRSVLSSYPGPRLPRFKASLGSARMISAAALLSQFVGRK